MRSRRRLAGLVIAVVVAIVSVLLVVRREPPNRAPEIDAPGDLRVLVGRRLEARFSAHDADRDPLTWSATRLPAGARVSRAGRLRWSPSSRQVGTYRVRVVAEDRGGGRDTATVLVLVRHPPHPQLYVAMGDSIASGHGLDWRDWLGRDSCWRDGDSSYPARFLRSRTAASLRLRDLALVACSGHGAGDLLDVPVSGGPSLPGQPDRLAQVEWAVVSNPGLVSITVGGNDLGFARPERAIVDGALDESYVRPRLRRLDASFSDVVRRLLDTTDAAIVITTYHNPTADNPHGVRGCRGACFRRATERAVGELNATIRAAVRRLRSDRITVVDVAEAFDGRGAPNGRGPDFLRRLRAPSWLPSPITWTSTIHAYCASGHRSERATWVSAADCIHPNHDGARAFADAIADALR